MKKVTKTAAIVFSSRLVLSIAIVLLLMPVLLGQQSSTATPWVARMPADKQGPLNPQLTARLVIGPGDLLTITIFNVPELLQTVRVSETGDAILSLIGNM